MVEKLIGVVVAASLVLVLEVLDLNVTGTLNEKCVAATGSEELVDVAPTGQFLCFRSKKMGKGVIDVDEAITKLEIVKGIEDVVELLTMVKTLMLN